LAPDQSINITELTNTVVWSRHDRPRCWRWEREGGLLLLLGTDQCCGSGSGIRCFCTPRLRDGAMVGSGSGISKRNLLIAFKTSRIRNTGTGRSI
jgi:hypothetical protein